MTLMRSAHTATKGGVIALARQLAAEGAWHGIRVNCISPGMIMTPATQDDIFGDPTHPMYCIRDHIPLGRIGIPDDIAPAALFLASDESAYMTGANLVIDGRLVDRLPGAPPPAAHLRNAAAEVRVVDARHIEYAFPVDLHEC
jgi:meso-butanediol dehydrogenase/(S,S)-butanediol dehydrogenase/diacetyl reductase